MANYGGIQLPNINEQSMDDRKERRQILNYLQLLDEKLKYMFQNIDIEENLSADSQEMFFKYGEDIRNVIKDTEGNFSLFEQTINGISMAVQDVEGNVSLLQQTATSLSSSIASAEGKISNLEQTAQSIETMVADLDGDVSTLIQTANSLTSTVKSLGDDLDDTVSTVKQSADKIEWIVESGTSASSMRLTDDFLEIIADSVTIQADVELYGLMKVYEEEGGSRGGYIGFDYGDDPLNGATEGIKIADKYNDCYVLAHGSGVTLWADGYGALLYYYNGNFMPTEDGDQILGDPDFRWQGVYAKNGTIQTSDARLKENISYEMERYETFYSMLKPAWYKMVEGESGRYHVGFISQDVEKAMEAGGLTSMDFAGFIKTPVYAEKLENGAPDTNSEIVDHKYSLRYDEFAALNTHMIQKLMKRVEDLENKLEALS